MKRGISIALIIVLLTGVLTFGNGIAVSAADKSIDDYKASIAAMQKDLSKKQALMNSTAKEIQSLKNTTASQVAYKNVLDRQIQNKTDEIEIRTRLIAESELQITVQKAAIEKKSQELDQSKEMFKSYIRFSYEENTGGYLEVILGSESLTNLLQRMDYLGHLLDYNKKVMDQLGVKKKELEVAEAELKDYVDEQEKEKKKLEIDQADLNKKRDEATKVIANLKANTNKYISTYEEAQRSMDATQAEIAKMVKELQAKQNAAAYVGGTFRWPLDSSYISSYYGNRRNPVTGRSEFHSGIDISKTSLNAPIYAANSGTVLVAEYKGSYGNCVIINHGGGWTTLYAHANKLYVKAGQKVNKGDVIAGVGTTGVSTGYHLHFEISRNGSRIDPMSQFKKGG